MRPLGRQRHRCPRRQRRSPSRRAGPCTGTGVGRVRVVPSPSWPLAFQPQHAHRPRARSARSCTSRRRRSRGRHSDPVTGDRNEAVSSSDPFPSWPVLVPKPQHSTVRELRERAAVQATRGDLSHAARKALDGDGHQRVRRSVPSPSCTKLVEAPALRPRPRSSARRCGGHPPAIARDPREAADGHRRPDGRGRRAVPELAVAVETPAHRRRAADVTAQVCPSPAATRREPSRARRIAAGAWACCVLRPPPAG